MNMKMYNMYKIELVDSWEDYTVFLPQCCSKNK